MRRTKLQHVFRSGILIATITSLLASPAGAQTGTNTAPTVASAPFEEPDAQRTRDELSNLLEHYPPSLQGVLQLDSSLLSNQAYLAPYPALVGYLNAHPEIARNPSFYLGKNMGRTSPQDRSTQEFEMWRDVLGGVGVFAGFGMAIGLIVWLIRTLVDYRRWNRLTKVQTEAHTKLLDRFTANEDLLAYIQSPAGAKFLESSPIALDASPRTMGAPLGRILWSIQAGLVLVAAGIGLQVLSTRISDVASQAMHAFGVLGIALGLGFVFSAVISFVISRRLGLIETASRPAMSSAQR
ncbi:MAG: hypothetical protein M3Y24_13330 [Acidobacteriota bacterium]|nr:hypothetical protein [Acidobacteriota bacterium]